MDIVEFIERTQNVKLNNFQKTFVKNLYNDRKPVAPKIIPHHISNGNRAKVLILDEFHSDKK